MRIAPWKTISSKYLVQDQWLSLRADTCALPNGTVIEPFYIIEERDWAHVIAFDQDDRILLTRQYRHASGTITLEFPGGIVDTGEQAEDAAMRELREEAGCEVSCLEHLATTYPNPARQTNRMHAFLAREIAICHEPEPDATEELETVFMSIDEVKQAIRSGVFCQAPHIGTFYLALEHLGLR